MFGLLLIVGAGRQVSADELRLSYGREAETLLYPYAEEGVSFLGSKIVALDELGFTPAIKAYYDMDTGKRLAGGFLEAAMGGLVDYSPESGWALVYEAFGRVVLVDTTEENPAPVFLSNLSASKEAGFFGDGSYVYSISERRHQNRWEVSVAHKGESWEPVYGKALPLSARVEFSEDRSSFVVFYVDDAKRVFTKLERYSATKGSLLSSIDLSFLELEADFEARVKSSLSGRYTVIVPSGVEAYIIIDNVEELGAVRFDVGEYPRVIGFSSDGNRYAVADGDRIAVFDTVTGNLLAEKPVPIAGRLYSGFDFSGSGERMLIASRGGEVSLIDLEEETEMTLHVGLEDISVLRFSPQENQAVVGSAAGEFVVVDLEGTEGTEGTRRLSGERGFWSTVSQDGNRIFAFTEKGRLREYAGETLEELSNVASTHSSVGKIITYSDSSRRVLSERDGGLQVHLIDGYEPLWASPESYSQAIDMDRSGSLVAYSRGVDFGELAKIRIYEIDTNTLLQEIVLDRQIVIGIRFSPDGTKLYVVETMEGVGFRIAIYAVEDGSLLGRSAEFESFFDIAVSEESGIFVALLDRVVRLDAHTGALLGELGLGSAFDFPEQIRLTPDGSKVGISMRSRRLFVYDWAEEQLLYSGSLVEYPIDTTKDSSMDFDFINDDGDVVLTWWSGLVEVLRAREGRLIPLQCRAESGGPGFSFSLREGASYRLERSSSLEVWTEEDPIGGDAPSEGTFEGVFEFEQQGKPEFLRVWEYRR